MNRNGENGDMIPIPPSTSPRPNLCQAPSAKINFHGSPKSFLLCSLFSDLCSAKFADHYAHVEHNSSMMANHEFRLTSLSPACPASPLLFLAPPAGRARSLGLLFPCSLGPCLSKTVIFSHLKRKNAS